MSGLEDMEARIASLERQLEEANEAGDELRREVDRLEDRLSDVGSNFRNFVSRVCDRLEDAKSNIEDEIDGAVRSAKTLASEEAP